jgi:8-oxo-dGTP pyrophosphatase MutT (NUDIX family)
MSIEPQKFFIGLIDFFSVLLPGALLTFLLKDEMGPYLLGSSYSDLEATGGWIAFLFSSYLLGQFLFLIGSLLDDYAYDPLRRRTDESQIARLLQGRKLSPRFIRWLAKLFFKHRANAARDRVIALKEEHLHHVGASGTINAFQWSKTRLSIEQSPALLLINQLEAVSKFFRSFVPVLIGLIAWAVYHGSWDFVAGLIGVLALAVWRFMEQRFKSTQQAYWTILTMEAEKQLQQKITKAPGRTRRGEIFGGGPTHAGGVVFRTKGGRVEYLLVQAKADAHQWVLPKGHIEPGEDARICAIREVREETGVWAEILKDRGEKGDRATEVAFGMVEYKVDDKLVKVRYYLMSALQAGTPEERWRRHVWLPLDKARDRATHGSTRELLEIAETMRKVR